MGSDTDRRNGLLNLGAMPYDAAMRLWLGWIVLGILALAGGEDDGDPT